MRVFTIWFQAPGSEFWEYTAHRDARDEDEALDRFFASCMPDYRRPGDYRVTSEGVLRSVTKDSTPPGDRVVAGMLIKGGG